MTCPSAWTGANPVVWREERNVGPREWNRAGDPTLCGDAVVGVILTSKPWQKSPSMCSFTLKAKAARGNSMLSHTHTSKPENQEELEQIQIPRELATQ